MSFFGVFFAVIGVLVLLALLRFFFRFVLPIIIQMRALRKAQKQFFRQGGRGNTYRYRREEVREGEVTVEQGPKQARTIIRDGIGETVEYEEVE